MIIILLNSPCFTTDWKEMCYMGPALMKDINSGWVLESKLMAYILITRPSTDILIGKYYGYIASFYYRLESNVLSQ